MSRLLSGMSEMAAAGPGLVLDGGDDDAGVAATPQWWGCAEVAGSDWAITAVQPSSAANATPSSTAEEHPARRRRDAIAIGLPRSHSMQQHVDPGQRAYACPFPDTGAPPAPVSDGGALFSSDVTSTWPKMKGSNVSWACSRNVCQRRPP